MTFLNILNIDESQDPSWQVRGTEMQGQNI